LGALDGAQVVRRLLAAAAILDQLELDLLTFGQGAEAGALDGTDVDEGVGAAVCPAG